MQSFFFETRNNKGSSSAQHQSMQLSADINSSQCYGVFHEPAGQTFADHAVLFLYPWGQEYVRSHRAIRRLALNLQAQGVASFRFDYRGTGDAGGLAQDFALKTAQTDAQSALLFLEELTGVEHIKVCAVRLGSLIGLEALANPLVKEFHLWDPILDGGDYLLQLQGKTITSRLEQDGMTWINGYPLTKAFKQELEQARAQNKGAIPTTIYGARNTPALQQWTQANACADAKVRLIHCHTATNEIEWCSVDVVGGFVNPHELLQSIEKELKREISAGS